MRKFLIVGCLAAGLSAAPHATTAAERRSLPPLALADLGGTAVEAPLPDSGRWLLVYVRPGCARCDALLDQMNRDERSEPRRIAIVVAASPEAAQVLRARYANVADARWLLDADGSAAKALLLPTVPAALGLRDRTIEWTLAGALRGGAELESVLFSWLGRK